MNSRDQIVPNTLALIGRALYGERWQTALATDLNVADRTMRRWLAGESPIPDGLEDDLQKLLAERLAKMDGLAGRIPHVFEDAENMTQEQFNELLKAMLTRGDKKWVTPSGSMLDVIRSFIKGGDVDAVSTACRMYFEIYGPVAANYISSQIPAILINNYKPIYESLNFDQFIQWATENPNWQDDIREHAAMSSFGLKVHAMVASISDFKRISAA